MTPIHLDAKFWSGFAQNFWEKKPLAVKNVQSGLREVTAAEIFELLVLFANRCRKLKDPEGFKLYIDSFRADADTTLQLLPGKKDKSLTGYHERMEKHFSDYCLVCDELLKVNLKSLHLLTDFTDQLYRHVGFPNRFAEIGLYLGNYRKTPFGVHVDSCGVFSFPVLGKKRFRLWSPEFAAKNPALDRASKYEKFKKRSQVIDAEAGDMTYWPSSAWHIAESDGSFSATWSLGIWVDRPHVDLLMAPLKSVLAKKIGPASEAVATEFECLHGVTGEVTELPQAFSHSIELLQSLNAQELHETFLKFWMQHISLQGFKNIPSEEFKLSMKSRIRLRSPGALVLWQQGSEKSYFSFAGALAEGARGGSLLRLIRAINNGQTCHVDAYLKGKSGNTDLLALQTLAKGGAFSLA